MDSRLVVDHLQGECAFLSMNNIKSNQLRKIEEQDPRLTLPRALQEKVEEEGPQPLELEVQIVALRRRGADAPPSAAASAREEVAATS